MIRLVGATCVVLGTALTVFSGWTIVRGPFFGGEIVDPQLLFASLFGFVIGIVVLAWGGARYVEAGVGG